MKISTSNLDESPSAWTKVAWAPRRDEFKVPMNLWQFKSEVIVRFFIDEALVSSYNQKYHQAFVKKLLKLSKKRTFYEEARNWHEKEGHVSFEKLVKNASKDAIRVWRDFEQIDYSKFGTGSLQWGFHQLFDKATSPESALSVVENSKRFRSPVEFCYASERLKPYREKIHKVWVQTIEQDYFVGLSYLGHRTYKFDRILSPISSAFSLQKDSEPGFNGFIEYTIKLHKMKDTMGSIVIERNMDLNGDEH